MLTPTQIKWRAGAVVLLVALPVAVPMGVGYYHLASRGYSLYASVPLALCFAAAYILAARLMRQLRSPQANAGKSEAAPSYWTEQDRRAWEVVLAYAEAAEPIRPEQLGDLPRYARQAQSLALEVGRVYRPDAAEPFAHLSVPEILACGELVAADLAQITREFIPGSDRLSLGDLRFVQQKVNQFADWYPKLQNAYWLAAAVFNPVQVAVQVALSRGATRPASRDLQQNVVLWFQQVALKQLGRYLIDLNSGRLKVGAKRYRELLAQSKVPMPEVPGAGTSEAAGQGAAPDSASAEAVEPLPVTVAIVGPVKAGKSSLVNAILGEQRAATDVLPLTAGQVRYQLKRPGYPQLTLIDTLGFGHELPAEDDVRVAVEAVAASDVVLVVSPARSSARKPEVEFLARIRAGIAARPELKMPPAVGVLTQIDLLTPAMEWKPPYDWRSGTRPKEASIRAAVEAASEAFAPHLAEVVPVCVVPGKDVGVRDELMPVLLSHLEEARGVGFLRLLYAEADADKTMRLVRQVRAAGVQAARVLWAAYRAK